MNTPNLNDFKDLSTWTDMPNSSQSLKPHMSKIMHVSFQISNCSLILSWGWLALSAWANRWHEELFDVATRMQLNFYKKIVVTVFLRSCGLWSISLQTHKIADSMAHPNYLGERKLDAKKNTQNGQNFKIMADQTGPSFLPTFRKIMHEDWMLFKSDVDLMFSTWFCQK